MGLLHFIFLVCFLPLGAQAAHVLSAGVHLVQMDYEEEISGGGSREKGLLPFLELGYRAPLTEWTELDLRFLGTTQAKTDYSGTVLGSNQEISAQDEHTITELEGLFSGFVGEKTRLFAGLGWKRWDRKLTYGTGYREIYQWWTATLGAAVLVGEGSLWNLWIEAAIRPMLAGSVDAIFSETVQNAENSNLTLGTRLGYRLRFPWGIELQPSTVLVVTPWYEQSGFGESDSVYNATPGVQRNVREPSSQTKQLGLGLSLRFFL